MTKEPPIYGGLPYLKPILKDEHLQEQEEELRLEDEDTIVDAPFNDDLMVTFLYEKEEEGDFHYVQSRDLKEQGITQEELFRIGLDNLLERTDTYELQLQQIEPGCHVLLLDGNFEASLILLDELWDNSLTDYVENGYAVAVPARDVLMFCDAANEVAIAEMRSVIEAIWQHGDHLLTKHILTRREGKWFVHV